MSFVLNKNNLFVILMAIMLGGLVHTLESCNSNDGSSITVSVSHEAGIINKIKNSYNKMIDSVGYKYVSNPLKHISGKDKLLSKLIQERFQSVSPYTSLLIAKYINKDTKGVSWPTPLAVVSIIEIESQFNSSAVSSCGAKGLMQISPIWSDQIPYLAYTSDKYNIKYGIKILSYYYKKFDGNKMAAILAYNSGDRAYDQGKAWPTYWWRYKDAHIAFNRLYQLNT